MFWKTKDASPISAPLSTEDSIVAIEEPRPKESHARPNRAGLVASATRAAKSINEDAHAVYASDHVQAVFVSDGIGSSIDAHLASTVAVRTALAFVKDHTDNGCRLSFQDGENCIRHCRRNLDRLYRRRKYDAGHGSRALQTTLLLAVETRESILVTYSGNGSVYHLRGDCLNFLPQRLPWCFSDLAIGHSQLGASGKEELFGFLQPGTDRACRTIEMSADPVRGDLIILCTDGISSPDQCAIGRGLDGRAWMEFNPHLERFLRKHLGPVMSRAGDVRSAQQALEEELAAFLQNGTWDDDATIAVLITHPMLLATQNENALR